jgi:hypothetical protein
MQELALEWVNTKSKEIGFDWINGVEAHVAKIPQLGLRVMSSFQEALISGVDAIKSRFDNLSAKLEEIQNAQNRIDTHGSSADIEQRISQARTGIKNAARSIQRLATQGSQSPQSTPNLDNLSHVKARSIERIFSNTPDVNNGILSLGKAAAKASKDTNVIYIASPDGTIEPQEQQTGWFRSFIDSWSRQSFSETVTTNPLINERIQKIQRKKNEITGLLEDLSQAQQAEQQLQNASWMLQHLATSPVTSPIYTVYNHVIQPSFTGAMDLWKNESAMLKTFVQFSETSENIQQTAARTVLQAGMDIGQAGEGTILNWLGESIVGSIEEKNKEETVSTIKKVVDWTLYFGAKGLASYLIGGLIPSSPVVLLPFLMSKALPDLISASAWPVSQHLGKSLLHTSSLTNATGNAIGRGLFTVTRKTFDLLQARMNILLGHVDPQRVENFRKLSTEDQRRVFDLVTQDEAISSDVKKELQILASKFFSPSKNPLNEKEQTHCIQLLLASYDSLSPHVLLNISPAHFSTLIPALRRRIVRLVKKEHPTITINGIPHLVELFNKLEPSKKDLLHNMIIEEYMELSREQRKEFCFHIVHSAAYTSKTTTDPQLCFRVCDVDAPPLSAKEVKPLLGMYKSVTSEELADVTPQQMLQASAARQIRAFEILDKYCPKKLNALIESLQLTKDHIIPTLSRRDTTHDLNLFHQLRRLAAGMASLLRQLRKDEREEWQSTSQTELNAMRRDEVLTYIGYLIQQCPDKKQLFISMEESLQKKSSAKDFSKELSSIFNSLSLEQKKEARNITLHNSAIMSTVVSSCRQEIANLDSLLLKLDQKRAHLQREMRVLQSIKRGYEGLPQDTSVTHNISVLSQELAKKDITKEAIEHKIGLYLDQRQQLATLLIEEQEEIPAAPNIQGVDTADPVAISLSELLIRGLAQELEKATTLEELEQKYAPISQSIASLKANIPKKYDLSAKRLQTYLDQGIEELRVIYQKKRASFVPNQTGSSLRLEIEKMKIVTRKQDSSQHRVDRVFAALPRSVGTAFREKVRDAFKKSRSKTFIKIRTPSQRSWKILSNCVNWVPRVWHRCLAFLRVTELA